MNRSVHLASKTIAAIDFAIEADQGKTYRYWLEKVLPHIGDAYRQDDDQYRSHLGASYVGNDCARAIYYSWRWFTFKKFNGRILRLFNRGHMEEARMIACLLTIGVEVIQQDANGNQFRISHAGGHVGGAGDGVGLGIPDLDPDQYALLEFKTHGEKSFKSLVEDGVRDSKIEHYAQMQCYMRKMELASGLYLAVNKNTDELYGEIIVLNPEFADSYLERGRMIVSMPQPPSRISDTPGYYKCRFCDHRTVCHNLQGGVPEFNCRTCVSSEALPSGEWHCKIHNCALTKQDQIKGCSSYQQIM